VELVGNHSVLDKQLEWYDLQRRLVGSFQNYRTGGSGLLHLEPTSGADAPSVTGLETRETVLRHGGREVIAEGLRGVEEDSIDDAANGVDAEVVRACFAAAGSIEAGHGVAAASGEGLAEDVVAARIQMSFQAIRLLDPFHSCKTYIQIVCDCFDAAGIDFDVVVILESGYRKRHRTA
jgi:hypothetical protein